MNVIGPIDHGLCQSIYFAGPEGLTLEIATSEKGIDAKAWVDPASAAAVGISPEELEQYERPEDYASPAIPLPQPAYDPSRPHMRYPKPAYEKMLSMSDDEVARAMDYADPPVKA